MLILISCTNKLPDRNTSSQTPSSEFGEILSLKFGESLLVGNENLEISFLDIQDSRCPQDVNCMTEGKAKVQLQVKGKDLNETVQIVAKGLCYKTDGSCGTEATVNSYKVQMINVDPYPLQRIGAKEKNILKFVVRK